MRFVDGPKGSSLDCAGWDRLDAIGDIASDVSASSFFTSVSSASTTDSSASAAFGTERTEASWIVEVRRGR